MDMLNRLSHKSILLFPKSFFFFLLLSFSSTTYSNNILTADCPEDITIPCNYDTHPDVTGQVDLNGGIGYTVTYVDIVEEFNSCENLRAIITRNWIVLDSIGNIDSCMQTIQIEAVAFSDIVMPEDYDGISQELFQCYEVENNPDLTLPENTGYPTIQGSDFSSSDHFCDWIIYYDDLVFPLCANTYDIIRIWTLWNICEDLVPGQNPAMHYQRIRVADTQAPLIDCPESLTISTNQFNCSASFQLPELEVEDECAELIVNIKSGCSQSGFGTSDFLECGPGMYNILYSAIDSCGNSASCTTMLEVVDDTAPVAVCDEITQITLNANGEATLSAHVFDDGSWDNCSSDIFHLMSTYDIGDPNQTIYDRCYTTDHTFTCNDLGDIQILMIVFDQDPSPYFTNDANGVNCTGEPAFFLDDDFDEINYNLCQVTVQIKDKLPPIITFCPSLVTVSCDTYLDILAPAAQNQDIQLFEDMFGTASFFDNCNVEVNTLIEDLVMDCGDGHIKRSWNTFDESGNGPVTCNQLIMVDENLQPDFTNSFINQSEQGEKILAIQSAPNPFKETTTLSFVVDTAQEVSIRIINVSGQLVFETKFQSKVGTNDLIISELEHAAVYFCEIQTLEFSHTLKLIKN